MAAGNLPPAKFFIFVEIFYSKNTFCLLKDILIRQTGKRTIVLFPVCFGEPSGIRTPDTLIKSQVLCQLS